MLQARCYPFLEQLGLTLHACRSRRNARNVLRRPAAGCWWRLVWSKNLYFDKHQRKYSRVYSAPKLILYPLNMHKGNTHSLSAALSTHDRRRRKPPTPSFHIANEPQYPQLVYIFTCTQRTNTGFPLPLLYPSIGTTTAAPLPPRPPPGFWRPSSILSDSLLPVLSVPDITSEDADG